MNFINDIYAASKLLEKGFTSSLELTNKCFEQIEKLEDRIGAFLHTNKEAALESARSSDARREKGLSLSKIDGIPIALKDMILNKGMPNTAASKILENYMPPYEATVVKKLRKSGAVIIGKNNQDEFAMGSSCETSAFKICRNPWNLAKTPGGSSGGSAAAVAADMAFGSLGTDTGGSIRLPAAYSGVVGLKPTYGRVSRFGVVAFASSLDQVGPFAKTVKGCAMLFRHFAGFDPNDSTSQDLPVPHYEEQMSSDVKGKKIGVPKEYFQEGIDDQVRKNVLASIKILEDMGAEIVEISLPHTSYAVATYYIIAAAEASSNLARYDGVRYGPRLMDNGTLQDMYHETRGKFFGPEVKRRILLGSYVLSHGYYDAYYLRAQKVRRLFANDFAEAFKKVDVIISPTTPNTAFNLGEKVKNPLKMYLNDVYTIGANLAGLPGISVPVGFDSEGLPIGAQILAKPFDEQSCFNFALAIEEGLKLSLSTPLG